MAVTDIGSSQKTIQQIIDETSKAANSRNTGELGKDDFLNLLVTQLRYQDPLKPVDDKEFIGQMAQFSALEQMQNLNNSFSSTKAFGMMGKYVTGSVEDDSGTRKEIQGAVTNVKIDHGKVYVVVKGKDVPVEDITAVSEGSTSLGSSLSDYTGLLGYKADGLIYDSDTGNVIQVSGVVTALKQGTYEDYAVLEGVTVEIADLVTDEPSGDPNFIRDKLEEAKTLGTEIGLNVIDRATGKKVPVNAKIKDYKIEDGKITVDLQECYVPVESISGLTRAAQQAAGTTGTSSGQQAGTTGGAGSGQ